MKINDMQQNTSQQTKKEAAIDRTNSTKYEMVFSVFFYGQSISWWYLVNEIYVY